MERPTRRRVLATTGAALAAGLAGCTGDGGDGGGDGGSDGGDGGDGGTSLDVSSDAQTRVDNFLTAEPADSNYDGTITAASTVEVGVEGNQANYAYGPAAIAVEQGTTVNWEWTGKGNQHNVVATGDSDFELDSGDPQTEDSYEFTFEEAGVALYECVPHKSLGMKGAVVVVASGG